MNEQQKAKQDRIKDFTYRVVIAVLKAALIYLVYYTVAPHILPLAAMVPGVAETIETFIAVYIVLMIIGDLTAGTIYNCFLNAGRVLFVISYLIFSIGDGVISTSYETFSLTIDLTILYVIAAMLGMLGFARTALQAINFMSERAESGLKP